VKKLILKAVQVGFAALLLAPSAYVYADDPTYSLTLDIPVDITRMQRNFRAFVNCTITTRDGKPIDINNPGANWSTPLLDANGALQGHLFWKAVFPLAKAENIDWGGYSCNLLFRSEDGNNALPLSPTASNPDFKVQPGSQLVVSGSLY
jgi:hypothetical protein